MNLETSLKECMAIDGALGTALVDYGSGMALGVLGGNDELDLNVAAAGNTDVVRAKMRAMELLDLRGETIEDMLITLSGQFHLIRPLTKRGSQGIFLYLVLDRKRANLALARHRARQVCDALEL
ncbi:hypothetical protein [Streptacidiphilus sp. ASG 303]|uniref:hypothetical protein n=1 Tax=Streptomycetaceae TaxID=2062 RepID=UPI001E5E4C64|nr:hypothetical protein [Streptacidiphilus sp. ASG 303]MCD0483840.1 hypothetical protein [Streptacidiphilus sp. ASG 303]